MKSPKAIYILIGVFCVFAIIAGVYAEFFVSEQDKPSIIVPTLNNEGENTVKELTQEEIKAQFSSLFNNQFEFGDYDTTNIEKINENENIVYTAASIEQKKENYEININLPAINITGDVPASFNNITQTIFVNKATEIINTEVANKTIYSVSYEGFINGDILSVVIQSTLKEGNNPQRVIVQTYNYDLVTGEKVEASKLLSQKNIIQSDCQKKINSTIQDAQKQAQTLVQSGYTVYNRDLTSSMYLLSNISTYFLGPNGNLYIIFAYGNQNFTSEMDIIWYE